MKTTANSVVVLAAAGIDGVTSVTIEPDPLLDWGLFEFRAFLFQLELGLLDLLLSSEEVGPLLDGLMAVTPP